MSKARNDADGYKRGAKGFGKDKGLDVATTSGAKKLYEMVWPEGKVMEGSGKAMPAGSAAKGSNSK